MVVRELVALLGVKTDTASVKKADNSLKGVIGSLKGIAAAAFGVWATVRTGLGLVELASDANETLNVLNASFGESQQAVLDWAASFAKSAGRSEFDMREMAGTLGAVLNPLMEGNAQVAAEMSTRFSELAVDLGSFFNAAEPDVLMALRSGITGEAEPLKRFGVVMTEATLANFAMTQGITKSVKSMSIAEKTALRYNFILETTKNAHGDAAKTSGGWANASKALVAKLKDAGTRIGFFLLPVMEKAVAGFSEWIDDNEGLIDGIGRFIGTMAKTVGWLIKFIGNLPPGAKIGLVAIAFLKWGKALKFLLSPFGKIMILVGLLILVIDDLTTWVEGGDSVFGEFFETLDELTGLNISEYIKNIILWFQRLAEDPVAAVEELIASVMEFGHWLSVFLEDVFGFDVVGYFGKWWDAYSSFQQGLIETILAFINLVVGLFDNPAQAWAEFVDQIQNIWSDVWPKLLEFLNIFFGDTKQVFTDIYNWLAGWVNKAIDLITSPFKTAGKWIGKLTGLSIKEGAKGAVAPGVAGARVAMAGVTGGAMIPGAARAAAGGARSLTQNTDINVNIKGVPGMTSQEATGEVAKQIRKEMEQQNRAALQALTPAKAS